MPASVNGYVLAGGRSSRMGRDKAMLELAGKPLVQRAVEKLRRVCAKVFVVGNRPELEIYAPVVRDLHEGCGPLGGIEAALQGSDREWNLLMAVDMPFLPAEFLAAWTRSVMEEKDSRVALFTVDGRPQPALCLLHRDISPFASAAIRGGELKLYPVLLNAAQELAAREGVALNEVFWNRDCDERGPGWAPVPAQQETQHKIGHLWFANLNTPEEFAEAEAAAGLLDG